MDEETMALGRAIRRVRDALDEVGELIDWGLQVDRLTEPQRIIMRHEAETLSAWANLHPNAVRLLKE